MKKDIDHLHITSTRKSFSRSFTDKDFGLIAHLQTACLDISILTWQTKLKSKYATLILFFGIKSHSTMIHIFFKNERLLFYVTSFTTFFSFFLDIFVPQVAAQRYFSENIYSGIKYSLLRRDWYIIMLPF